MKCFHIVDSKGHRQLISISVDRVGAGGGYRGIDEAARREDLRAIMLEDALVELNRVRFKYRHLRELLAVFGEIDAASVRAARKKRKAA